MANFVEGRYSAEKLRRNRAAIIVPVVVLIALFFVLSAITDWPWGNAIASSALTLVFGAALWWMFASSKAGPVGLSQSSKTWFSDLAHPWNKRQPK